MGGWWKAILCRLRRISAVVGHLCCTYYLWSGDRESLQCLCKWQRKHDQCVHHMSASSSSAPSLTTWNYSNQTPAPELGCCQTMIQVEILPHWKLINFTLVLFLCFTLPTTRARAGPEQGSENTVQERSTRIKDAWSLVIAFHLGP